MPKRKNPSSLRSLVIACVGRHFEKICYGCKSSEDVNTMIDTSSYLTNETPLATFPASLLEDMYNLICRRKCNAHYLHSLMQPQIRHVEIQQGQRWNRIFLASGIDFYIYQEYAYDHKQNNRFKKINSLLRGIHTSLVNLLQLALPITGYNRLLD